MPAACFLTCRSQSKTSRWFSMGLRFERLLAAHIHLRSAWVWRRKDPSGSNGVMIQTSLQSNRRGDNFQMANLVQRS